MTKIYQIIVGVLLLASVVKANEVTVVANVLGPEGPLYVDGNLYYVAWTTGELLKWDGTKSTVLNSAPGCSHNGLAITKQRTFLIACSSDPGLILETTLEGKEIRRWNADKAGKQFIGGMNDIAVTADGGAYATIFGPFTAEPTIIIGKILYLAPGKSDWVEVADNLNFANGLGISPDQKTLYVCETAGNSIKKFTIDKDGSLTNRSNFVFLTLLTNDGVESPWLGPDSMKVDRAGNLYVAQYLGGKVLKVSPTGQLLHTFKIDAGVGTTNVALGKDEKQIFVTVVRDPNDKQSAGSIVRLENND